jgi:hypothetical protein
MTLDRLKRWLRPLRPILRPIWRRTTARLRPDNPDSFRNTFDRQMARIETFGRWLIRRPVAIRPLRHHEIVALAAEIPYYRVRVEYLDAAAGIAADLIRKHRLHTALELGPHLQPLIVGADTMSLDDRADLRATGRRLVHDATNVPWPADDRAYDLFVALQVFEHLGTSQPEVFREVRRVARHAILSLPIDWEMTDPTNVHHMLRDEQVRSWFAPVAPTSVVVGNGGRRKRLVYVFEDLPPVERSGSLDRGSLGGPGTGSAAT